MGGGTWQKGLPHPHPLTSYWQTPFSEISNHRSTPSLPSYAEYVIVGTGISGASIATKLLSARPSADILLLEARTVCSGATGRNGGHCSESVWAHFKRNLDELGLAEAIKIEQWELENVKNVVAFIRKHGIDCDLEEVERVAVTKDEADWETWLESLRARDTAASDTSKAAMAVDSTDDFRRQRGGKVEEIGSHKVYHGQAATDYLNMPGISGAVVYKGYTLSPYKLVNEMVRRLIRQGVNLQTTTPVLSVDRDSSSTTAARWIVRTERGSIRVRHVLLATNAYTGALYNPLTSGKHLIPTRAQAVAIRPGETIAGDTRLHKALGLDGDGLEYYMMQRPAGSSGAGDLILGGGRNLSRTGEQWTFDDSVVNQEIHEHLLSAPAKYYSRKGWGQNGRLVMAWTGIMGYTKDHRPLIGERSGPEGKGFWICAGFNGHGMALTFQAAQAVVDMLTTGQEPDWFPKAYRLSRTE